MKRAMVFTSALLAIAACGPTDDSATANEALSEGAGDISQASPEVGNGALPIPPAGNDVQPAPGGSDTGNSASPIVNDPDDSENSPPTVLIPAQYRGRWGMVRADCEPGRSDAKGLVSIDAQSLRFYESVAALQEQRPAIATSFSGVYSFTGEGQTWERVVVLTRDGDKLTRAEGDQRYTYTRC